MLDEAAFLVSRPTRHNVEEMVGRSLVAAMERQFGIDCSVEACEERCGDDEVDLIIGYDDAQVAVECLAYIQRDEAYEIEYDSTVLAADLAERLNERRLLPRCVTPLWRSEIRAGDGRLKRRRRLCFPKKGHRQDCYLTECVNLIQLVQDARGEEQVKVQWGPSDWNRKGLFPSSTLFVDAEQFLNVSQYLQHLDLSEVDAQFPGTVRSGTSFRMIGADIGATLEGVDKKLKRLPAYRRVAAGKDVVLLIHEDGYPSSRVMPEMQRDRMFHAIRRHILGRPSQFDAVWWLHTASSSLHSELVCLSS